LSEMLYDAIKTNITCNGIPALAQRNCPTLNVIKSLSACDGETQLSTLCPNTEWKDIKWNVRPSTPLNTTTLPSCYWVENLTGNWGPGAPHRVNGTVFGAGNGDDRGTAAANKIDGGVYIYINTPVTNNYMHNANNVTPGSQPPFCQDRVHKLSCSVPSQAIAGSPITPKVECRSGDAPINPSWSNAPSSWTNPTAGTYNNISVAATCAGVSLNANCGNLKVVSQSSVINVNINYQSNTALTAGNIYNATFADRGGKLLCPNAPLNTIIGTIDGVEFYTTDGSNYVMRTASGDINSPRGTKTMSINVPVNCRLDW